MTTGQHTKRTLVHMRFNHGVIQACFAFLEHGEAHGNWWIIILNRPKSLIPESDTPISSYSFSTSFALSYIIFASIFIKAFSKFRLILSFLFIDLKEERSIKGNEIGQIVCPPVLRVYEKTSHQSAMRKTSDWWKVVENNFLKTKADFEKKALIHQSISFSAPGGACATVVSYRSSFSNKRINAIFHFRSFIVLLVLHTLKKIKHAYEGWEPFVKEFRSTTQYAIHMEKDKSRGIW